jgi:hypothetical protein
MVVAADDVGDAHIVVVDHDREHVGRRAVGAQDDEVVEVLVLEHDACPAHGRRSTVSPLLGRLDADHRLDALRRL